MKLPPYFFASYKGPSIFSRLFAHLGLEWRLWLLLAHYPQGTHRLTHCCLVAQRRLRSVRSRAGLAELASLIWNFLTM